MEQNDVVFGIRAVIEAIHSGKEIDKILCKRDMESAIAKELFDAIKGTDIHVQRVPQERLNRVTMKNHQGVIAFISPVSYEKLEHIVPFLYEEAKNPMIVLLDGLTDVRNFGAIARTCEVAGVDAIVIPQKNSVSINADAIKTSAGALMRIPVCREASIRQSITFLQQSGYMVVAATEKGTKNYTQADYTGPVAIVMGGEDFGISTDALRQCDEMVTIPQFGSIGSLNVSVAAGVLIYEAVRQRTDFSIQPESVDTESMDTIDPIETL